MSHNKLNYADIFRQNGYRLTKQRQAILDAICIAQTHATIGEIFFHAKKLDRGLDRSTLYRSLDTFIKLGLVISAEDLSGERVYEIAREDPHHHLACKQCGSNLEVKNEIIEDLYQALEAEYQYSIEMDHLNFWGVCPDCR